MSVSVSNCTVNVGRIVFDGVDGDQDIELEAKWGPICEGVEPAATIVGDKIVFGYAVVDESPPSPKDDMDGEGEIILFGLRYASTREMEQGLWALGLNSEGKPALDQVAERYVDGWICDPVRREAASAWAHEQNRPWHTPKEEWEMPEGGYGEDDLRYAAAGWLWEPDLHATDPFECEWIKFAMQKWREMVAAGEIGAKYSQVVDVYEHGGIHASLGRSHWYPDEQWDVVRGGGVWIPDAAAISNLDEMTAGVSSEEAEKIIREYAAGCIKTYVQYWNGNVYGVCVETHSLSDSGRHGKGTRLKSDIFGGCYGSEYARQAVVDEVNAIVAELIEED